MEDKRYGVEVRIANGNCFAAVVDNDINRRDYRVRAIFFNEEEAKRYAFNLNYNDRPIIKDRC